MHAPARLRAGPWEAGLLPELGGAIVYLTRDGRDVRGSSISTRRPEGNFLCVEPASIDTLDPGETLTMRITS